MILDLYRADIYVRQVPHHSAAFASRLFCGHSLEMNKKLQNQTIVIVPVSFHLERTFYLEKLFFSLSRNKPGTMILKQH